MKSTDDSAKINLFGEVKKAPWSGNHRPDKPAIAEILTDGMAMAIFCTGCGNIQGLTQAGLDSILNEAGLQPIPNPAEYFLRCTHCPICSEIFADMGLVKNI